MNAAIAYDVVIFDLDGTLTESEPGIVNCVQYALEQLGYRDVPRSLLKSFIGPPLYEAMREKIGMDDEAARKAVACYRERFQEIGWRENSVYEGIPRMLRSLKQQGVYLAIATSKPELFARRVLEHFGIGRYFDRIEAISLTELHSDKTALVKKALPERYQRACMVGDRMFDIQGARDNGIEGVGVSYGYAEPGELAEAGADWIMPTVDALTDHLLGGRPRARGSFITFEGIDGCGKSTQWRMAAEWLRACGHEVVTTREPGGSPVAEKIRELVLSPSSQGMTDLCEAYLFAAARAQHVSDVLRPAIDRGAAVLCDRYVDSSIAYQGAGRGLGSPLVQAINQEATRGCMPDRTIVLDLDADAAAQRRAQNGDPDRIEAEDIAFVHRVREGFKRIAAAEPERIRLIDAQDAPEVVFERVKALLMEALA